MKQIRVSNFIRELSHAFETLVWIFIEIKGTEIFEIYVRQCRGITILAITEGSPTKIEFPQFF